MAEHLFSIILVGYMFLHICTSFPQYTSPLTLKEVVLDGRNECNLMNYNPYIIKLFKAHQCPEHLIMFSENYFDQRDILPCIGAYDALYRLCEFPEDKISTKVPKEFRDPKAFCVEASRIFKEINFTYKGETMKKWFGALIKTMQDETLCNNLCVLKIVNEQCVAMLTFNNEYLRLNETLNLVLPGKPQNNENIAVKPSILMDKPIALAGSVNNSVLIHKENMKNSSPNVTSLKANNSTNNITQTKPIEDKAIVTDYQDNKAYLKINQSLVKSGEEKVKTAVTEVKKTDVNSTAQNLVKSLPPVEEKPVIGSNTNVAAPPDISVSHIQKISSNDDAVDLEGTIEGTPQVDDVHGSVPMENEEGFPQETGEKGFEDTELEKPLEEGKTQVKESEQRVVWPAMSNGLQPLRDNIADSADSYSFPYIVTTMAALCMVYLLFHYRNKLLALALEGRKGKNYRGRGRPSSANYSKLHSNLEEAIASNVSAPTATHVLY